MRVVDASRKDLTKGLTRRWSVAGVTDLMVRAHAAEKRQVPAWLSLLHETHAVPRKQVETAIFGMS